MAETDIEILVKNFKNLNSILEVDRNSLIPFFGDRADEIFEMIEHVRE